MFELADFYRYCRQNSISVIPYPGAPAPGTTLRHGDLTAVFLDFSQIRSTRLLKGVCSHELGHMATGALHKVASPFETVERSEYRANRYVAENYLTAEAFREAFSSGCRELWELSEYFDMPEEDIKNALTYWSERRGEDLRTSAVSI